MDQICQKSFNYHIFLIGILLLWFIDKISLLHNPCCYSNYFTLVNKFGVIYNPTFM